MQPGFDLFARQAMLERRLRAADLVVTGEGAIDLSTLMGKGVGHIAQRCHQLKIPCIGLAGMGCAGPGTGALFTQAHALTELATVAQTKASPAYWLERLAEQVASSVHGALHRRIHRRGGKQRCGGSGVVQERTV
jgi:glycerate kinase